MDLLMTDAKENVPYKHTGLSVFWGEQKEKYSRMSKLLFYI